MAAVKTVSPDAKSSPARSHWGGWLTAGLLLIAAVFIFLPTIASALAVQPGMAAWLAGQPPGSLTIGAASWGWQSPLLLADVVVKEDDGQPVAQVKSVQVERSFWDFLLPANQPLQLNLTGLKLSLVVPDPPATEGQLDLSAATDQLQHVTVPRAKQPIRLKFSDTEVEFLNPQRQPLDKWTGLAGSYVYESAKTASQIASLQVPAQPGGAGQLQLDAQWGIDSENPSRESLTLTCQGTEVSLAAAQSWLKKYLGPEQDLKRCGGTIQAHFQQDKSSGWNLQATARLSSTSSSAGAPPRAAELDVSAAFSKTDDKLTIAKCQAAAEGAALALSGEITEVARRQLANLSAEIQSPGFAPLDFLPDPIRQEVRVDGLKFSQISIRGPLKPAPDSPDALEISLIAGWQSAVAYGLASSGGQLRLAIADGQLRAEPLDVSIGGGRLRQLPALDFRSNPPELVFSEGPMLENVALTEEVCRNWLKYVSPTLANATAAEGEFSLSTKAGRIPVGQPAAGRLGGTLVIHRGQVRPGPLAMQALQRANEIQGMILRGGGVDLTRQTLLTIQNEDVNFALQDGRVYHDDFGFYVKEMRVSTTGSVGLDQSLDLLLNMELPDAWFRNAGPILQSLRGEKIQLVVAGTLDKPAIDGRPLAEFGKRIGIKAGAGLLERIIERRMERGR